MKKQHYSKKPLNKALQLSGAGLQMGLTIYVGFLLGKWLDAKFKLTFLSEKAISISSFSRVNSCKKNEVK